jgi:hypothetical protein
MKEPLRGLFPEWRVNCTPQGRALRHLNCTPLGVALRLLNCTPQGMPCATPELPSAGHGPASLLNCPPQGMALRHWAFLLV